MNIDSKLNPFGNYGEPWPAATYKPHLKGWRRKLSWWWRNPLHNFGFHWIGVADHVVSFEGDFLKDRGLGLGWTHTEYLKFPIVSYRGKWFEHYAGWRPNGGFGIVPIRKSNSKDSSEVG